MDIVHIDPGYGKGLTTNGTLTTVENEEYNPTSGVAFTGSNCTVKFPALQKVIPSLINNTTFYIACKFSLYREQQQDNASFSAGFFGASTDYNYFHLSIENETASVIYNLHLPYDDSNHRFTSFPITSNTLYNFAFTAFKTKNTGIGTATAKYGGFVDCDGRIFSPMKSNRSDTYYSSDITFFINFLGDNVSPFYISNVILATGTPTEIEGSFPETLPVDSSLQVVRLPLTSPSGDFLSVGDGEYVGNTSGQKLLQTINASDVITKYGASSKVSHLVTYGAPGYRVGSNINQAYGISEEDGTITQHGSNSLSTDTDASAYVAWETPDTKLTDLDGLKIGWQV